MPRILPWPCPSCGTPLGVVVRGRLRPNNNAEPTDFGGRRMRVRCKGCGTEQVWTRQQ